MFAVNPNGGQQPTPEHQPGKLDVPTPENNMKMMNDYITDTKSQQSKKSFASRTSKKSKGGKSMRMVSFREMRQIWKQKEEAHLGPGAHDF
jgi:hypothetical protein